MWGKAITACFLLSKQITESRQHLGDDLSTPQPDPNCHTLYCHYKSNSLWIVHPSWPVNHAGKKRLWRQTLWTRASQTVGFLVWASTHVLSMFSGSEKGVISLSHFLKCFQVSSCRDKSRARSLKTTEEGKTLSGVQECMLSVFKNKPKLDQRRGLNLAGIMSSFTFSDRQRGLWGLCWL